MCRSRQYPEAGHNNHIEPFGRNTMKKLCFYCLLSVFCLSALSLLPGSGFAGKQQFPDSRVKGLWLVTSNFPNDAKVRNFSMANDGVVSYTRTIKKDLIALTMERLRSLDEQNDTNPMDNVPEFIATKEGVKVENIALVSPHEALSNTYTYPVILAEYISGNDENALNHLDMFMFTDEWIFRYHVTAHSQYKGDYKSMAMDWFGNLKFQE